MVPRVLVLDLDRILGRKKEYFIPLGGLGEFI